MQATICQQEIVYSSQDAQTCLYCTCFNWICTTRNKEKTCDVCGDNKQLHVGDRKLHLESKKEALQESNKKENGGGTKYTHIAHGFGLDFLFQCPSLEPLKESKVLPVSTYTI